VEVSWALTRLVGNDVPNQRNVLSVFRRRFFLFFSTDKNTLLCHPMSNSNFRHVVYNVPGSTRPRINAFGVAPVNAFSQQDGEPRTPSALRRLQEDEIKRRVDEEILATAELDTETDEDEEESQASGSDDDCFDDGSFFGRPFSPTPGFCRHNPVILDDDGQPSELDLDDPDQVVGLSSAVTPAFAPMQPAGKSSSSDAAGKAEAFPDERPAVLPHVSPMLGVEGGSREQPIVIDEDAPGEVGPYCGGNARGWLASPARWAELRKEGERQAVRLLRRADGSTRLLRSDAGSSSSAEVPGEARPRTLGLRRRSDEPAFGGKDREDDAARGSRPKRGRPSRDQ